MNIEPYSGGNIILANDNFGCGSSREHAVWALRDFGIKVVIASSFGDIFYNNCFKNNVLPIVLSKKDIDKIFNISKKEVIELSVSLDAKKIVFSDTLEFKFEVENNLLERIIYGLDDVDITLKDKQIIIDFEQKRMLEKPWIYSND